MEDIFEIMKERHSVRKYKNTPIAKEAVSLLQAEIDAINAASGLFFELCLDDENVFQANRSHYGSFSGCRNYFALYGNKNDTEKIGYFGEMLVLLSQKLGLNTCWVALTFEKRFVKKPPEGFVLHDVIALGYGENCGFPHKSKPFEKVSDISDDLPDWYRRGIEAALLAPTALNQQKFYFSLTGDRKVLAKASLAPYAKTDLGIVKYHFELGAGKDNFSWDD